jgi:8-amino-7-oxononanoate synthase
MSATLEKLAQADQLRRLEAPDGVDLNSNDYLGLARDSRLRRAIAQAIAAAERVGGTASRLLSGHDAAWEALERQFAAFVGAEAALYFTSGYAANLGLLTALLGPDDIVFSDAANHASLIDGLRLAGVRKVVYPHGDMAALEHLLAAHAAEPGTRVIVTESIFSMDGDAAPFDALARLAERWGAALVVDEAHALGVLGPGGRGLLAESPARACTIAAVYTCGKALGSAGAFVCGSRLLIEFLINRARPFIFSTAAPPYLAAQIAAALELAAAAEAERRWLAEAAAWLRAELRAARLDVLPGPSPIVPVILGSNRRAVAFAAALQQRGFWVRPIRPPTVPPGTARVRLSLTAALDRATLERLAAACREAAGELDAR